jgi:hypothetical protein
MPAFQMISHAFLTSCVSLAAGRKSVKDGNMNWLCYNGNDQTVGDPTFSLQQYNRRTAMLLKQYNI